MATHDYVIDNSTGANVRADINNVLQAILTNNSSSSAPSTTAAYMWWADTTNGVLKIRNSANNGWVELLQLDGTLTLEDGSASTPALAFRDDLNTGIFSSAADTFNVATGGVERMELGATTIFNEDGADVDFRIEGDTDSDLFYVNAGTNRVGIGTSGPNELLEVTGNCRLSSGGATRTLHMGPASAGIEYNVNGTTFIQGRTDAYPLAFKTNSSERMRLDSSGRLLLGTTTEGSTSGDDLTIETSGTTGITLRSGTSNNGNILFSDGTSGNDEIRGVVQYAHSDNSMRLMTNAAERMRIDSSGRLLLGLTTSATTDSNAHSKLQAVTTAGPNIFLGRDDSDTADDSRLGVINFGANHGGTYHEIVTIRAAADAQHASNSKASRLELYTTSTGNTTGTERMRIDSSGNVGIGSDSPNSRLNIRKSSHYVATNNGKSDHLHISGAYGNSGELSGSISFGVTSSTSSSAAAIAARQYSSTAHQLGLSFFTHPTTTESDDSVEHLRLLANGKLSTAYQTSMLSDYAQLDVVSDEGTGGAIRAFMDVNSTAVGYSCLELRHQGARSGQDAYGARFKNSGGHVCGSILLGQSTTAYNTSSDYRLKENVVPISDGITRLKTLKPYRFNWIEEKGQPKVDGFFAHEVTAVPEAVKGTKDAVETTYYDASDTLPEGKSIGDVKDEASPVYQQIDQSKLVPLLVAAVQELITKVETLEAA